MKNINNTQKILDIIKQFLAEKQIECDHTIVKAVNKRNNGYVFSFEEHLKAMIFSLLSSQTSWNKIDKNYEKICNIFFDFDKAAIKKQLSKNALYFSKEMKNIKCSHQNLEKQMQVLATNIATLEKIEAEYGLIDNYVTSQNVYEIIKSFSRGKYKLHQMGVPLVCEYLRNVGFNLIKPDRHTKRILGSGCLAFGNRIELQDFETLDIAKEMEKNSTYKQFEIDFLLWHFCAKNYGEICIKNSPKCNICPISTYCQHQTNISDLQIKGNNKVIKNTKKLSNISIEDAFRKFLKTIPKGTVLNSHFIKKSISESYAINRNSIMPADYCYNSVNKDKTIALNFSKKAHFFERTPDNKYIYLGENIPYNGYIFHKGIKVGKWTDGQYEFFDDTFK